MISVKTFLKIVQFAAILSVFAFPSQAMFLKPVQHLKKMQDFKSRIKLKPEAHRELRGVNNGEFVVVDAEERVMLCGWPTAGFVFGVHNGKKTMIAVGTDRNDLPYIKKLIKDLKETSNGKVSIHLGAADKSTADDILSQLDKMNIGEDEIDSCDFLPLMMDATGKTVYCRIEGGFHNLHKTGTSFITLKE